MRYLVCLFFFLLMPRVIFAKQLTIYGARPFVSLTKALSPRWDLNAFYSETINFQDTTFKGQHIAPRDFQSYFQAGLTYKYSPHWNFTAGYVFQRSNPFNNDFVNENRLWQQVIYAHNVSCFLLAHRFRFEERFIENRATKQTNEMATRLRYQIGFTAPFQGKEIDPGEFYFTTYNESYISTTGQRNAWYSENWTYAGTGYQTSNIGKFEIGPLAQWAKINKAGDTRMFYLFQLGWSYSF